MSEFFQHGEIVNITITGARVREVKHYGDGNGACLKFEYGLPAGGTRQDAVFIDAEAVAVERVAPAEWPPRPGDLWQEVDGALWFAQGLGGSQMALVPATVRGNTDSAMPYYVLETFGPLTLVHREDKS